MNSLFTELIKAKLLAHLLIPQLENSLRHLAVTNDIIVTTYEKRFQLENLLGGLISKIRQWLQMTLSKNWKVFLSIIVISILGTSCYIHGLLETTLVHKYGLYAWWLCLKMILQISRNKIIDTAYINA